VAQSGYQWHDGGLVAQGDLDGEPEMTFTRAELVRSRGLPAPAGSRATVLAAEVSNGAGNGNRLTIATGEDQPVNGQHADPVASNGMEPTQCAECGRSMAAGRTATCSAECRKKHRARQERNRRAASVSPPEEVLTRSVPSTNGSDRVVVALNGSESLVNGSGAMPAVSVGSESLSNGSGADLVALVASLVASGCLVTLHGFDGLRVEVAAR
jgi:hypothetical protein